MAACLAWLAIAGERQVEKLALTCDEPGHLAAGLSYWKNGAYNLLTGNYFFTQKWMAWPLVRSERPFPAIAAQAKRGWNASMIGGDYLYDGKSDPRAIIAPARRMTLLLCLATAALIAWWATQIGGRWAGALAMLLYVTSPVVLANGALVTPDTGAALAFLIALVAYDALLSRPALVPALATGAGVGLLLLSKFTLPVWLVTAAVMAGWSLRRQRTAREWLALLGWHAAAIAMLWITVWVFFGFRYQPGGIDDLGVVGNATMLERTIGFAARCHLLPQPLLSELVRMPEMLAPRPGYLLGHFQVGGHWEYFLIAFLTKSTIALLAALAAWVVVRRARPKEDANGVRRSLVPVIAALIAYFGATVASPLNIGVRHILPVFAFASILGGVGLSRLLTLRNGRVLVSAIAALAVVEVATAAAKPHAWFNALAGGSMNGYRILIDSSLEWGGDVPDLVAWQKQLPATERNVPVFLSVLGPPYFTEYGLEAEPVTHALEHGRLRAGYYVFSATRLEGGTGPYDGAWTPEREAEWQKIGAPHWHQPLEENAAALGASQLAAYCRTQIPARRIGPVYFVFRLDERALEAAMGRGK